MHPWTLADREHHGGFGVLARDRVLDLDERVPREAAGGFHLERGVVGGGLPARRILQARQLGGGRFLQAPRADRGVPLDAHLRRGSRFRRAAERGRREQCDTAAAQVPAEALVRARHLYLKMIFNPRFS